MRESVFIGTAYVGQERNLRYDEADLATGNEPEGLRQLCLVAHVSQPTAPSGISKRYVNARYNRTAASAASLVAPNETSRAAEPVSTKPTPLGVSGMVVNSSPNA